MKPIGTSILNLGRVVALPVAGIFLAGSVHAQGSDPLLEEITVVAQKREQNIMDVPVAITAVTGAQIEQSGIKDMIDLQQSVPGLIVGGSQTTTTSNFSIRGIGSTSNNFGVESSVGLYVDGVYRSRQSSLINELIDIEAVEVLRGPQGTLFGKNTAAGAINVRTVAPSVDERNAFVEMTVGDLDLMRISGASNFALTDEVAVRATYFQSERDGYVDNYHYDLAAPRITAQENVFNNRDRWGMRVQATYDNGENFNLRVIADYAEIDEVCCIGTSRVDSILSHGLLQEGTLVPGPDYIRMLLGGITFTDFDYPSSLGLPPTVVQGVRWKDYITSVNSLPISQNQDRGTSLEMNWDINDSVTMTSVTAFRSFDTYDDIDADFTDSRIAERTNDAEQDSFSQELRFAGTFGDSSNWVAGGYYFAQDIKSNTRTVGGADLQPYADLAQGGNLTALRDAVTAFSLATGLVPPGADPFPAGAFADDIVNQSHDGYAVFGQVDWALSDAFTLSFGARYTNETKDIDARYTQTNPGNYVFDADSTPTEIITALTLFQMWVDGGMVGAPPDMSSLLAVTDPGWAAYTLPPFSPRPDVLETLEDEQVTGTLKATWFINDSNMAYLSYATGYKAGGTNADRIEYDWDDPDNPLFSQLFKPEKSASTELGYKGDIGDHLRLSVAAYYTQFDDFQANTFEGSGFILRNAGDLEIMGVEVEWILHVLDNTTITGYYAHNQGEYNSFVRGVCWDATPFHTGQPDPGDRGDGSCDRTGDSIPYNPENRFQISLNQDFPMGNNNLFFRAEYAYASETTTDGDNDPLTLQDDFGILNVRVGVDIEDWNSTITLWGRNVTDERYFNGSYDPPLLDNGRMNSYPSEVATWGVTFRKNWD